MNIIVVFRRSFLRCFGHRVGSLVRNIIHMDMWRMRWWLTNANNDNNTNAERVWHSVKPVGSRSIQCMQWCGARRRWIRERLFWHKRESSCQCIMMHMEMCSVFIHHFIDMTLIQWSHAAWHLQWKIIHGRARAIGMRLLPRQYPVSASCGGCEFISI